MSSFVPETGFAQGASGGPGVYDTSPAGLGLSPSYLAQGASATAMATISTSLITGDIPSAGTTPTAGTGFTYTHGATGTYVFTLTAAMPAIPVVKVELGNSGTIGSFVSSRTTTGFTVNLYNSTNSAAIDASFTFIAIPTQ